MSAEREMAITCAKGTVGAAATTLAALVAPWQEHLAWGLGIIVGLATLFSLALDIRRKLRKKP